MTRSAISFLVALALISGCAATTRSLDPAVGTDRGRFERLMAERSERGSERRGYRIGADDRLAIAVRGVEELTGEFVVQKDGSLLLPIVGRIRAENSTAPLLASAIADWLRGRVLRDPIVLVNVIEYRGQQVSVLGAVANPGVYALTGSRETVMDLVVRAGGVASDASPKIFFLPAATVNAAPARAGGGFFAEPSVSEASLRDENPIVIDLSELIRGRVVDELELPVRAGDSIFVPPGGNIVVEGWVERPGPYPLRRGLSLTQAISKAGGLHFGAAPSRLTLSRDIGKGRRQSFPLDYADLASGRERDVILQTGDRVTIGANPIKAAGWGLYSLVAAIVSVGVRGSVALF